MFTEQRMKAVINIGLVQVQELLYRYRYLVKMVSDAVMYDLPHAKALTAALLGQGDAVPHEVRPVVWALEYAFFSTPHADK